MTQYLTLESLLQVAAEAVEGGVEVRDYGLLESSLARPRSTVFGADAYPDVWDKAAALLHSLGGNHGLVDGNKRLGWLATETFLWINGWAVTAADDPVFDLVIEIADGTVDNVAEIAERLRRMTAPR
ncbi:type II toxin-antitoxin system death-on-curing family toxin [Pseudonocardia dioxanivorans]|uniref:type II toxin-antitoxin system death-on-curing family toxin n=1 Tax=Pseudonocardia dioxanivorans TaxID=240495 RepID=UPI000CD0F55C|nr:type II toxin-antitoxin system death-on-curing family toxin [Pseudonocardia dioxanivorans]